MFAFCLSIHTEETVFVLVVSAQWHDKTHVGLGELLDRATAITLRLFRHSYIVCRIGSVVAGARLRLPRQQTHVHLVVALVAPVVL